MFESMEHVELEHEGTPLRGFAALPDGTVGPFLTLHTWIPRGPEWFEMYGEEEYAAFQLCVQSSRPVSRS